MINLFTSYYQCGDPRRQTEIDACLAHNVANSAIDKLIVFIDDGSALRWKHPKIHVINIDYRPTYLHWIEQTAALGLKGVSILCNSDIHFDEDITDFTQCFSEPKTFVALSRWEVLSTGNEMHPNPHWSQDVWAIHTKDMVDKNLAPTLDFPMGVPRCDNKIAYQFGIYGWKVINPCEHIKSFHVHETGFRTYDKKLDDRLIGGVAYVHPSDTISTPSKLDLDVWIRDSSNINKIQLNKSLEKWIREAGASDGKLVVAAKPLKSPGISPKANSPLDFMKNGEVVFEHAYRFRVYKLGQKLLHMDNLSPENYHISEVGDAKISPEGLKTRNLENWFPPILDISPLSVRKRPINADDCQFWQYPCSTEEQAFKNHMKIGRGENIDHVAKVINTYLALPWATYIDKKNRPNNLISIVTAKISGLSDLAKSLGYELRVHTVCQQIHWRRFINIFNDLGVTNLHLSHMETNIDNAGLTIDFDLHSWPLIAVNVETPERSKGISFDKPLEDRSLLASFIGAHMPHYRSKVRVQLFEAAKSFNRDDIMMDLGDEWHFNKIVYQEQVMGKAVSEGDMKHAEDRTQRYNRIISDSIFSLCPEGAGPNTLRVWESMAIGSIPVIIADEWIPPEIPGGELGFDDCAVIVHSRDVERTFEIISQIPSERRKVLKDNGLKAYSKFRDMTAFNP